MHPHGITQNKLQDSLEKMVADIGAAMSASLVLIGDRLGLYKALAEGGPMNPADLARRTGTSERYVREWLNNQAAGGYVTFDGTTHTYFMTAEQAYLLADESSAYFMPGAFEIIAATVRDSTRIRDCFRTGEGMAWGAHDKALFFGTERFFGANYAANLVTSWIPSLHGMEAKLKTGIDVADVGCGHGVSTILMAKAYPKSRFVGYDNHEPSIRVANQKAEVAGLSDNVRFEVGRAQDFPGTYDFVTTFDCLHDMADPIGAAKHTRERLNQGGAWMVVEPMAGDDVAQNLNPIGRVFYAASTMFCVPSSLEGQGPALGAQAGEKKIREVISQGGFSEIHRTAHTPFNLILEARP
jgi:2-polyprenyl-3-methyl-5-hydroxy-6-metoxy-1,4-benzoquinol methylase